MWCEEQQQQQKKKRHCLWWHKNRKRGKEYANVVASTAAKGIRQLNALNSCRSCPEFLYSKTETSHMYIFVYVDRENTTQNTAQRWS
jgi:hypothetical protein